MDSPWLDEIRAYYRSPAVQARIAEYCGGSPLSPTSFSCHGIAAYGGRRWCVEVDGAPTPATNTAFDQLLSEGGDICRAVADRGGALLQLDVDYVSPHDPGAPYRDPAIVFERVEPVHRAVCETFAACGVPPLVLATGRGYHYVVRAPTGSPLYAALLELGTAGGPASANPLARAHEGAGRLVEHLAHRALHRLQGRTDVAVSLADIPPPEGGPFNCLDLSAYGDPVLTRYTRCAFSANQKSAVQGAAPERPFVLVLPRADQSLAELLRRREDTTEASRWAEETKSATIPDVAEAAALLEDYRLGPVARFHAFFDQGPVVPSDAWPFTWDSLETHAFPACVAVPLAYPNPLLLRPSSLRTVCLVLWSLGWHPRSIAGLIRSKFERDHSWTPPFSHYDPALRAEFYVRVLCGALADGLDAPDRFTCETQRQSGLCQPEHCSDEARRLFGSLEASLKEKSHS